jgi:hypothetical protein
VYWCVLYSALIPYSRIPLFPYPPGLKARNAHWDAATSVEVEAETEENRECCRREADFELRLKRQTEHVHIPPAPFHPVLLLVDDRVPKKLKRWLIVQLLGYDFVHCGTDQMDQLLVLELQRIFDAHRHVVTQP